MARIVESIELNQTQWCALATEPISPDAPEGTSIRFDSLFEELQKEIQKIENPSATGVVDWDRVVSVGEDILRHQSKDLLVASYVCVGMFQLKGYPGLTVGLRFYELLIQKWWPKLFPEMNSMRGRINALVWLLEKLGIILGKNPPKSKDRDQVEESVKALHVFSTTAHELLGHHGDRFPESLKEFQNRFEYLKGRLEKFQKDLTSNESPQPPVTQEASQAVAETRVPAVPKPQEKIPEEIQSMEGAYRSLHQTGAHFVKTLAYIRSQDLTSPLPFRLLRSVIWAKLEMPEITPEGKTTLVAPPSSLGKQLKGLETQGAWRSLLETVEGKMSDFPLWLDLQRFSAHALQALGIGYGGAKDVVVRELTHLLGRMKELQNLAFSNGTPLADEDTYRWILGEVIPQEALSVGTTQPKGGRMNGQIEEIQEQVKELLQKKQEQQALLILQRALRRVATSQEQFHVRLEIAQLCLGMKKGEVALAHLIKIEQQIEQYSLEEWDPDATLKASQIMWKAISYLPESNEEDQGQSKRWAKEVVRRICRLDSVAGTNMHTLKFAK